MLKRYRGGGEQTMPRAAAPVPCRSNYSNRKRTPTVRHRHRCNGLDWLAQEAEGAALNSSHSGRWHLALSGQMIVRIGQGWRSGRTFVVIEASIMSVNYCWRVLLDGWCCKK